MKLVIDLTTQRIPESFEYSKYWKPTKCIIIQRAGFTHSLLNLLIKNVKKKKKETQSIYNFVVSYSQT